MSKNDQGSMSRSERKKQKNKKKKPTKQGLWKKILLVLVGLFLAVIVAGAALFTYYASNSPELTDEDLTGTYASDFVDMNGKVFYTLGGVEREFATADEYPEIMTDAMMAVEDQRFSKHFGIDPIGIGRAAVGYLVNKEIVGGGSTITQQLIKNSVFSTLEEDQTLERKAQEAWLAIQLEQQLSKEQIMTLYLNKIHMGGNVYGVATAAEEYYGKHVSELELHEAALLAGMPRAPNYYNPYNNEEAATNRRWVVLETMVDFGAITQEEADAAKEIPVTEGLQAPSEDANDLVYDAYIQTVLDEIKEKTELNAYTAGLTIHTNYDPSAQQLMYDVVNTDEYVNFPNDELQTAMTLIDSTTGRLSAIIGGRNREELMGANFATNLTRDVGSTMKPLSTYAPAIEFLQYSTYHQVYDTDPNYDFWPELSNYDNRFKGQMSMREALVDSRNVPTGKLFIEDLGDYHDEITDFLQSVGINTDKISQDGALVPSNSINGTMSPLDLAGAYTAFANNGTYIEPHAVSKVVTQQGEEIDLTPSPNVVMEDYTAYMINDMLKGVINHYSDSLTIPGYTHAAKTGTTNYDAEDMQRLNIPADGVPDNWVVGYSPYYTMSVWVGYEYEKQEGNYLTHADGTRSIARYIYQAAMSRLVEGLEQRDWQRPESVVSHSIENGTDPAELAAPRSSNSVTELFVRGNEPTKRAEPEVVELNLRAPSGLSARYVSESDDVSINWDSYSLPEGAEGDVEYVLSINDEEQVLAGTEHLLSDPPRGDVDISLAVRVGDETGPAANIQITVPEPEQEEEEEPEEEPEEPEEEELPPEDEDSEELPPEENEDDNSGNDENNDDDSNNGNSNNDGESENDETPPDDA